MNGCGLTATGASIGPRTRTDPPCNPQARPYLERSKAHPFPRRALGVVIPMTLLPIVAGLSGLGVFCAVALKGLLGRT
jgi:hypothetical protein